MNNEIVIKAKDELNLDELENSEVHRIHVHSTDNSMGVPWRIPLVQLHSL